MPVVLLGLAAAGCAAPVDGAAQPDKSLASPAASTSVAARTSGNPFAARNQCALLDKILAGQGFPKATPSVAQSDRSCASQKPSVGRPSIEQPEPLNSPGQCDITMAVEPHSRASLLVTSSFETKIACEAAEKYATALEPLLPKG